jgi:hypothetical protein
VMEIHACFSPFVGDLAVKDIGFSLLTKEAEMLKSKFKVLLVGLTIMASMAFANAAVVDADASCQSAVVQASLLTFDVEKQLPVLSVGEGELNLVVVAPALVVQGEQGFNGVGFATTSDLFARARVIEKVGWRISI